MKVVTHTQKNCFKYNMLWSRSANSDGWRVLVKFWLLARKCIKAFWFTATIYHFKREKNQKLSHYYCFREQRKYSFSLDICHHLTTPLRTILFFQTNILENLTLLRNKLWGVWCACSVATILLIFSKEFSQTFSVEEKHLKFFEICQLTKCSDI